ncbi:MAG: GNAT family N-acetyltransferase [Acidobacteria bacterium]|nr:GNAT family N-acetyltransferase [Acidobacteriota bacterium]
MAPVIRPAERGEMRAIRRLIAKYPQLLMQTDLPRTPSFFVADLDGRIIGCAALQIYSRRLAEIRSLAVDPDHRHAGVGRRLVEACQLRAAERGVTQVMAVTSSPQFFERSGFSTFKRERIALFWDTSSTAEAEAEKKDGVGNEEGEREIPDAGAGANAPATL